MINSQIRLLNFFIPCWPIWLFKRGQANHMHQKDNLAFFSFSQKWRKSHLSNFQEFLRARYSSLSCDTFEHISLFWLIRAGENRFALVRHFFNFYFILQQTFKNYSWKGRLRSVHVYIEQFQPSNLLVRFTGTFMVSNIYWSNLPVFFMVKIFNETFFLVELFLIKKCQ